MVKSKSIMSQQYLTTHYFKSSFCFYSEHVLNRDLYTVMIYCLVKRAMIPPRSKGLGKIDGLQGPSVQSCTQTRVLVYSLDI